MSALAAWDVKTGDKKVKVAVIDTGIQAKHEDLMPNLIAGYNFVKGNSDATDDNGHGNYCAGLIGAKGGDTKGMVGMNWEVSLMPVKAADQNGCISSEWSAKAIQFSTQNGAAVISASWGGLGFSTAVRDAISAAGCKGALFVASAGDTKLDLDSNSYFPASYDLDNMLVVGASDDDDKMIPTGFGKFKVHLSAPGKNIASATLYREVDPYEQASGASPAVALVAGAAALVN